MTGPVLLRRMAKTFLRKECGGLTLEGVLWLPIYGFFIVFIVNGSLVLSAQAQAQRTVQDANRLASTGFLQSEAEIEANIVSRLAHLSDELVIDAEVDTNTNIVTTLVAFPAADVMPLDIVNNLIGIDVTAAARHQLEMWPSP